jgi:8-oxo-dGTP pyrophosphatase MutT (NUDIX family)
MDLKHAFYNALPKGVLQRTLRFSRGMTLGARTAVIDGQGRFLLVKHTYSPGWIFPGGGVERGETCEEAALRELKEEADVRAEGPLALHGIFSNQQSFPGDHLAFYVLREFSWNGFSPTGEIAAAEFFAASSLPEGVLPSTQRRIDEMTGKAAISGLW